MDKVRVNIGGSEVEIERPVWDVLYRAINVLVDTGDIIIHIPALTSGQLAKAKMASGALYLIANRPPRQAEQQEELQP